MGSRAAQRPKHIDFALVPDTSRKTRRWLIRATATKALLGEVKWFGRWRQYCFYPSPETVFDSGCMRDIADFCADQMQARRAAVPQDDLRT